jgi:MFS family permease
MTTSNAVRERAIQLVLLTNPHKPPVLLKWRSSKLFIIIAVCIAVFSDVFLYAVIVPVIPFAIRVRAGVPAENVQHWVSVLLAIYGAALLVTAPIAGVIADRYGSRRVPLLGGLVVLAGATLMLCFGRSMAVLVVGRLLQGASAGVVWVVALALLSDTVSNEESAQALGYVGVAYSIGVLVAPLLGGVVYDKGGYYAVFGMTFGVIGLDIVLRLLIIEQKVARKWLDGERQVSREERSMNDPSGIELANLSPSAAETEKTTATSSSFPATSKKRKLPTMLILLKSRRILAAFWGSTVVAATFGAMDSTLPLFCKNTFGWSSLGAGLMFIPLCIPSFLGPLVGYFTDRYGPRWIAALGLVLSLPGWVLLRLIDHDNVRQVVLLCALLVVLGVGGALILTSLISEFSKVCDAKERQDPSLFGNRSAYAQSYGIFNVAWAAGSLIGPLWAAGVLDAVGWKTMTWTLGLLNAVSVVPIILYSGGYVRRRKHEQQSPNGAADSSA